MKKLLFIPILFISSIVFADTKITDLTELTSPTTNDILVVIDMNGTPTTKKMIIDNLLNIDSVINHINLLSSGTYTHAEIDSLITSLGASTDTLRIDVDTLKTSTSTLEGYINNLYASTSTLEGYIFDLWISTSTLENYITDLWTSTSAINVRITNLETSTSTLEGYIYNLWTDTATLRSDIDSITTISTATVSIFDDMDDTGVAQNYRWIYNGSKWVAAAEDTTFTFSIATFADDQSNTQLIGSGQWLAIGGVNFTASYNNGPPTTSSITLSSNGGVSWTTTLDLTDPFEAIASSEATNYPTSKDQYVTFTLNSKLGDTSDSSAQTVTFRNYVFWGTTIAASGLTESDIEGLSGSSITNDYTISQSINAGANEYIVIAYPTSYTAMDAGDDYENDGGTDFKFNSIAMAMIQDNANLSITNSAGETENYDVYISSAHSLGNHTFVNNTSDQTIDPLYYGITTTISGFTESDVEGLANNSITNDNTQVWSAVIAGSGEYLLFAFPKRLGEPSFKDYDSGFAISWVDGAPETVSVTNSNIWTEDYYVWRSNQPNLGTVTVESY